MKQKSVWCAWNLAALSGAAWLGGANPSQADTPGSSSDATGLDEIVVTANKRAERLHDVPMSISALDQETISRLSITGIETLSREIPSLAFSEPYGGEPIISIRGISTGYGLAPATSVYIDDTPLDIRTDAFVGSGLIDLFDVDRIEVLRGPQGTLFGASSMGGAVRVITAQPDTKEFQSHWELGVSNTERGAPSYEGRGAVNMPLSGNVALRVVATYSEDGGWIDRSTPTNFADITTNEPITQRNENTIRKTGVRVALRWTPDDTWTVTPSFIYQNTGTQGQASYYPAAGLFVRPHLFSDEGSFNTAIASVKIEKSLGWSTLTSSTAYLDKYTNYVWDYSEYGQLFAQASGLGPIIPRLPLDVPVSYHQATQELRLTSVSTGQWRWIVGGYFNNTIQSNTESAMSDAFLPLGSSNAYYYDAPVHDHQLAAFGELTYAPSKYFEATAGLREYRLQTTEHITQGGLFGGADVPRTTASANGANPKLTATAKVNEQLNFYATAAKGFRAGGPNPGFFSGPCTLQSLYKTTYDPDTVWNYEVGSKAVFLDGRASLNVSAFQMNWKDFQGQLTSTCGVFTANIGEARIRGLELENNVKVNSYFSTHLSFAYDDAKIQSLASGLSDAGVGAPGDRIANVPRVQGSFGGDISMPVGKDWTAFVRPNYQYVGSSPTSYVDLTPEATRPAYSNIDLTAGVQRGGWELSLYAHNLTNSLQIVGITAPVIAYPIYFANRPRTIGLMIRSRY